MPPALAMFLLGAASCAFLAAGCFYSYRLWLLHWLTTDGPQVTLQDTPGGRVAVVKIDPRWEADAHD